MPTKITVKKKNHAMMLVDSEPSVLNELTDFFTFYVPGYKFMPAYKNKVWDGKIRLYNSQTRELYAGLFAYVREFANAEGRDYELELEHDAYYGYVDEKIDPNMNFVNALTLTDNKGESIKPRDYQLRAVEYALTNKRGMLISPTASGKSLIIYMLLQWYLMNNTKKALIIVPTTSLVEQMYSDFAAYGKEDDIFNIDDYQRIYSGMPKKSEMPRVIISTWQSIYKLPQDWFDQFGMVVGDECHGFKSKSLTDIMNKCTEAKYRIGTTGTLDNAQVHHLVLQGLFGKIHRVTTTKALQDNNTLAKLDINIIILKYNEEIRKSLGKVTYQDEIDWIVKNKSRNTFIRNLALDASGNTLVLFNFVEKHGKPLFDMINDKAEEDRKIFYVSGEVETSDREAIREITEKQKNAIIVASLGTFSTGINIKNLHNIIFASPSKSQIKVLQSIGRGLRKADDGRITRLYDIADDLQTKSRKNYAILHSEERVKIYNKEKFDYKIIEVPIGN